MLKFCVVVIYSYTMYDEKALLSLECTFISLYWGKQPLQTFDIQA